MKKFILLYTALLWSICGYSQDYLEGVFFEDFVYYDHIKTVQFGISSVEGSLPLVKLNRSVSLTLSFDDLEGGDNYYTYRILHCSKDWQPSDLDTHEFLEGFNEEEIVDRYYSQNRITDYTHYKLRLPNDDVRWTISGNYLLIVYEGDMEDQVPVITRRFMVVEDLISVGVEVGNCVDILKLKTHQQINLSVNPKEFRFNNPLGDLYATVLQNDRWDSAVYNEQPRFTAGNIIKWDKARGIAFEALKDFRIFDIRSLDFTGERVHSIELYDDEAIVLLDKSKPRTGKNFNPNIGTDGKFILDNPPNDPNGLRKEYANVIFNLENKWTYDGDVYIVGAFTDWKARPEFKMQYDADRMLYLASVWLKQGYYNYMFAVVNDKDIDCERIEGSWYETVNDYTALVYFSELGSRFDRLIGSGKGSTRF